MMRDTPGDTCNPRRSGLVSCEAGSIRTFRVRARPEPLEHQLRQQVPQEVSSPAAAVTVRGFGRSVKEIDMANGTCRSGKNAWPERFWAKVEKTETCWLWIAGRQADGYGSITVGGSGKLAHRVAYELVVGPIAKDLTLDHLCRVRHCVNPAHLEPVTNRVNILRGVSPTAQCAQQTSCKRGHPFTEANTRIKATPYGVARVCRSCNEEVLAPRRNAKRRKREPLITAGIAQDIYERAWAGESRGSIANHYGIGGTAVSNIKHGWSWSHVTGHVRTA